MPAANQKTVSKPVATPAKPAATAAKPSTAAATAEVKKVASAVENKAIVAATPAPSTPVVQAKVEEEVDAIQSQVAEQSILFMSKLQQISSAISALKTEYRALEKKWSRELKAAQKSNKAKKRKVGNRAPSGFVKPTLISPELASFLEKPTGCEMARTEVTRDINKYIRANNLQDKENGRKINPDAKLAALLKIGKTDELTYFNLQKYMSPHFAKATAAAVA
jgi:chromatin remodeling complex protein RSC6